jgi:hypothetical protein
MKKIIIVFAILGLMDFTSCGETTQKDNTTHNADTMVIKQDKTNTATNAISTDTTKR